MKTVESIYSLPSDADITGRNFGAEEIDNLKQVIESGTLNCTKGRWIKQFEAKLAERYAMPYARAMTSGTAAIHTAIAAIDPEPGDEIITTPITDMGALTPIVLEWLARRGQKITFFLVGQDAALEVNREPLRRIAAAGHEFGNHSFHHEPWMQSYDDARVREELRQAEQAIQAATGCRPRGFRGPDFCSSPALIRALIDLGYQYDASTLPSLLGPLARLYYRWGARLSKEESRDRQELFGKMSDGWRPLRPYEWSSGQGRLLEIPVSNVPVLRVPFHLSYVLWLSGFSKALALGYVRFALIMCRLRHVEPSFLLHPLDFISDEDAPPLAFFPGMALSRAHKMAVANGFLDLYQRYFDVVPLGEHARRIRERKTAGILTVAPGPAAEPEAESVLSGTSQVRNP
jgi:hypothetical protein